MAINDAARGANIYGTRTHSTEGFSFCVKRNVVVHKAVIALGDDAPTGQDLLLQPFQHRWKACDMMTGVIGVTCRLLAEEINVEVLVVTREGQ